MIACIDVSYPKKGGATGEKRIPLLLAHVDVLSKGKI